MIDEEDLANAELASKEPAQRFRFIERIANQRINHRYPDDTLIYDDFDYMSAVLPAAEVFGIVELTNEWSLPPRSGDWEDICRNFRAEANMISQRIMFEYAARSVKDPNSVALDPVTKEKLRFHIGQLRGVIDAEFIADWKKTDLYDAIAALEAEIDKPRTALGALIDVVGKAFEGDMKIVEALQQVVVIFQDAKTVEREAALITNTAKKALGRVETKQLPPPKPAAANNGFKKRSRLTTRSRFSPLAVPAAALVARFTARDLPVHAMRDAPTNSTSQVVRLTRLAVPSSFPPAASILPSTWSARR